MGWIGEQSFFERSLRNELISLHALRTATAVLAVQTGSTKAKDVLKTLKDIDEAILATEKLINAGSHHP